MKQCFKFFVILFLLNVVFCFAQESAEVKDLRLSLKKASSDSISASIYNSLAFEFMKVNDDSVQKYLLLARKVASKKNIAYELSRNYSIAGNLNYSNGHTDSAFVFYSKALRLDISLGSAKGMVDDYMHLGRVFTSKGDIDKGLEQLFKALELAKK